MPDVLGGLLARRAAARPTTLGAFSTALDYLNPLNLGVQGAKLIGSGLLGGARLTEKAMKGEPYSTGEVLSAATLALPTGVVASPGGAALGAGAIRSTRGLLGESVAKKTAGLADLRDLPIKDAIAVAKSEPHLVPKKDGGFVGGPPGVKTKADLLKVRKRFDKMLAAHPGGGDWYDRYRAGTREITGGDPRDIASVSGQQGMFSQGVSPESEIQFGLKENNASLAGMPQRAFYGAQHARHLAAVEANDPLLYTEGLPKVGEYSAKIDPTLNLRTATGTNDFRHARNLGYRVGSGTTKTALTEAQHRFVDYETALAVGRARDRELGGIKDWTGESTQAAPWVVQKTHAIVDKRNLIAKHMKAGLGRRAATKAAFDEAYIEANKTPADFFGKHTAFATHEAQPGEGTGHLPGSEFATPEDRLLYGNDPRSLWGTAPGGRDLLYAGLRKGDTGVAMRVRPSRPATGLFEGKSNPVEVGRPLVSFATGKPGVINAPDRAIIDAAETLRGAMDVQKGSAAHTVSVMGTPRRSVSIPMNRKLTPDEIFKLEAEGKKHGLLGVSDTGAGVTVTNFGGEPVPKRGLLTAIAEAAPKDALAAPYRTKVDSVYADLSKQWAKGEGSGAVTRTVLKKLNVTKDMRAAFDNNPHLAQAALDRISRDKDWVSKWGVERKDVEKFRRIIADGPGWIGRLKTVLKEQPGTLPALATGVFVGLNEGVGRR